jgi:hypothetical protein
MNQNASPRDIVDRQMRAYNARDIDAYCALYASDAVISTLNDGTEYARGIDAIRRYYTTRFSNSPSLHYDIKTRIELGNFVIDHERVTGIGEGTLEVIAIYEVRDSLIRSLRAIRP